MSALRTRPTIIIVSWCLILRICIIPIHKAIIQDLSPSWVGFNLAPWKHIYKWSGTHFYTWMCHLPWQENPNHSHYNRQGNARYDVWLSFVMRPHPWRNAQERRKIPKTFNTNINAKINDDFTFELHWFLEMIFPSYWFDSEILSVYMNFPFENISNLYFWIRKCHFHSYIFVVRFIVWLSVFGRCCCLACFFSFGCGSFILWVMRSVKIRNPLQSFDQCDCRNEN